jgi:hypothetical protein
MTTRLSFLLAFLIAVPAPARSAEDLPLPHAARGRGRTTDTPVRAFMLRSLQSKLRAAIPPQPRSTRVAAHVTAPLREDFESALFPPGGWTVNNPDPLSITWEHATGVSGYGNGGGAAWMDFYSYEVSPGHVDEMSSPVITGLTTADSLRFDYAYAEFDDPFYGPDSLIVRFSFDGGATFPATVFTDGGAALATAAPTSLPYSPGAAEWRTLRFAVPPAAAGAAVIVSFTGVNGFSNNLYVDNIFVGSVPANDIQAYGILSPDPESRQRTSFTPAGVLRNTGTAAQTLIPARFQILSPSGNLLYNSTVTIGSLGSGQADTVSFPVFAVPAQPGMYTVRLIAQNSGDANPSNDTATSLFMRPGTLSGDITVGAGAALPTLRAAVDTLNKCDVVGPVTFQLVSPVYNEAGPLTIRMVEGSGPLAPVLFTPASTIPVTINVPGTPEEPYAIAIRGSGFITIDGGEAPSGLTIVATGTDGAVAVYIAGAAGRSSGRNTLRNLTLRTSADSTASSSGFYGILCAGYDEMQKDSGNVVAGCVISRHGQAGIAAQNTHGLLVESCTIRDWVQHGGFVDVRGIWLATGATQTILRRNTIGNIRNTVNGWWSFGIENGAGSGSSLRCSCNSVWGISSTGGGSDPNVAGGIWSSDLLNSDDRYYHNSVFLSGSETSTGAGTRSAAFAFAPPLPPGLRLQNNIGVNTTDHLGTGSRNAFAVYAPVSSWPAQDTSDRNDWWTPGPDGATGYVNGTGCTTLADWRAATGQDPMSISTNPLFVSAGDLHIALGTSPAGNIAVPLSGETIDIDGEQRDPLTPDIGSDEFSDGHITVSVPLASGWNLIANPVERPSGSDSVRQLFPGALFPYAFAFSSASGYILHRVMEPGRGYWEKFGAPATAGLSGEIRLVDTIDVEAGWNMIGSNSVPVDTSAIVDVPAGLRASDWFGFTGGYAAVDTLLPGFGYWVKAAFPGRFILR